MAEFRKIVEEHNMFNSIAELYAVLLEEVEEYWDSVKRNQPDNKELVQVAAVAIAGCFQVGRIEDKSKKKAREFLKELLKSNTATSSHELVGLIKIRMHKLLCAINSSYDAHYYFSLYQELQAIASLCVSYLEFAEAMGLFKTWSVKRGFPYN